MLNKTSLTPTSHKSRGSAPRPTGGSSSRMTHFTPAFKLRRQEVFRRIRSLGAKRIQAAATARRLANVLIFQTGFSFAVTMQKLARACVVFRKFNSSRPLIAGGIRLSSGSEKITCVYSPFNKSSQSTPRATRKREATSIVGVYWPASIICTYRRLISAFSASCSWVSFAALRRR